MWPTRCAALDPTRDITALGTAKRPGHHPDPGARLPARTDPAGAAAAPARTAPCAPRRAGVRERRGRRQRGAGPGAAPTSSSGFGGYVAVPAYLAARRRRIPIVVHEANARPGLANRVAARLTTHVFTGPAAGRLPHAHAHRHPAAAGDRAARPRRAPGRAREPVRAATPTGRRCSSSAARRARRRSTAAWPARSTGCARPACRCCTSSGRRTTSTCRRRRRLAPYVVVPYVDQMQYAYAAADFALCRCGAMTCAELSAVGLPAAYVPYPGRQRRAAVQRAAHRRGRRRAAGRRRATSRLSGCCARSCRGSPTRRGWPRMSAAAGACRVARRRCGARPARAQRRAPNTVASPEEHDDAARPATTTGDRPGRLGRAGRRPGAQRRDRRRPAAGRPRTRAHHGHRRRRA